MGEAIRTLTSVEGVKVAAVFWLTVMEILENDAKRMSWVQMSGNARLVEKLIREGGCCYFMMLWFQIVCYFLWFNFIWF